MKILYDSENHTIRELKEGTKTHKMTRLEEQIFVGLTHTSYTKDEYILPLEMMKFIECDTLGQYQHNKRKLKKWLSIKGEPYVGSRLEDEIWII